MAIRFRKFPASELIPSLVGIAIMLALQATIMNSIVSPSAVVAGSIASVTLRYMQLCGYSIMKSTWQVRLLLLAVLAVSVLLGGIAAMLIGLR